MANRQVVQGVRTGGRSARVRAAILDAVLEELATNGYEAVTVESVAGRAGVNKTTVYRRWPTVDDLLVDALVTWSLDAVPVPDTGSVETDLLALGAQLADQLNGGVGRQIVAVVLTAGLRSPQLREATRRYFERQGARAEGVVARARDRGELPAATDADALLTTFRAPLFYRLVTTGNAIDDRLVRHAVDVCLVAAHAGLLSV